MEIRRAFAEDIPAIRQVADVTWPVTYGDILSSLQIDYMLTHMYSTEKLNEQLNGAGHCFFVAEEEQKVIGFVAVQLNFPSEKTIKLHKIYLLPDQQGKQLGRKLIDFVVRLAKTESQSFISLNVNRYNKARSFYEKMGFAIVSEEDIDIGNGYLMEDYVMERPV
jgi:diamine N-acetyltransferase